MWNDIIKFLNDINPLINLTIAVLWGVYVYYTIKTFKEIHRQTELQSEAFLYVSCEVVNSVTEKMVDKKDSHHMSVYDKWHEILKSHIPSAISQESYLLLTFKNKGRSDIVEWKADIDTTIASGQYLTKKFNIGGDNFAWQIKNESNKDIIPAGESVTFIIAKIDVYPQIECTWKIDYSDMRSKQYKAFAGDKKKVNRNSLAYSMKEN
jgi:hypothetical protein